MMKQVQQQHLMPTSLSDKRVFAYTSKESIDHWLANFLPLPIPDTPPPDGALKTETGEMQALQCDASEDMQLSPTGALALQLLDLLPIQIYLKDQEGRYQYLNAKARKYLGFPNRNALGKKDVEMIEKPEQLEFYRSEDLKAMQELKPRPVVEEWEDNNGMQRVNRTMRYPIVTRMSRQPIGVVSIAEDLTSVVYSKVTDEMISLITHDWINGFLSRVQNQLLELAELFEGENKVEENKANKDKLVTCSSVVEFLADYLDMLSVFSDVYSGHAHAGDEKSQAAMSPVRLKAEVFDYVRIVTSEAWKGILPKGLGEILDCSEIPNDLQISGEKRALRILAYQQCKNHMGKGTRGTKLRVIVRRFSDYVEIIFVSLGERLSDEQYAKLTEHKRGYQVPGRQTPDGFGVKQKGMGFGLYFCKQVAALHNPKEVSYPVAEARWDESLQANVFVYRLKI